MLVKGVAFKKSFSYAGFEQQPKSFKNPKILCLNVELELKAEKDNAEVRVEQVSVLTRLGTRLMIGISSDC
jgi:T-complex protein 1 subunit eta